MQTSQVAPLKIYIPPSLEQKATCSSALSWIGQKCRRFSRLTGQCLLFSINATRFAGMICKKIPEYVTNSTVTALSGVGFVFVPYNVDYLRKLFCDAYNGHNSQYHTVTILATLKGIEVLTNLGLLITGLGASIEGMAGKAEEQKTIYRWMTPVGEATLIFGMGLTVAYMVMNQVALRRLREVVDKGQAPQVLQGFLPSHFLPSHSEALQTTEDDIGLIINPDKPLASLVRFCMDKDTLDQLLKEIGKIDKEDLISQEGLIGVIRYNIETQQSVNLGGQVVLIIIGDILLAVEKYYTPTSLVSASINLGVSGAYTLKIIVETLREVGQRSAMSRIMDSGTGAYRPV